MAIPNKAELRREFLEKRNQLTPEVRSRSSAIIRESLLRHPLWRKAQTISIYISFGSEVDTHLLIQDTLRTQKRVVVPWVNPDSQEMSFSELKRWDDLAPGFYKNILEPRSSSRMLVDPSEIHLALAPGVIFDRQGGRIGMGGGYYDRLLPQMTAATRLGLGFDVQIHPQPLRLELHDMKMHAIITETEWIFPQ